MTLAPFLLFRCSRMAEDSYSRKLGWLIAALLLLSSYAKGAELRGADIHFRGPVFAISHDTAGAPLSMTIQVNRSQIEVQLNPWTEIIVGRGFRATPAQVRLGHFLEVDGFFTSTGRIVARRIHVEGSTPLELEGVIEWVQGGMLRVAGIDLVYDDDSRIRRSGETSTTAPAALQAGETVRLLAELRQGVWACLEVETGPRTVESEPLRLEGRLVKVENQLMSIDVGVGGVAALVAWDQSTQFTGSPRVGLMMEIEGRFLPGTALIKAIRVAVDTNDNGNVYDDADALLPPPATMALRGAIASLRKIGARIEFLITETRVVVDTRTKIFKRGHPLELSELANGLMVEVVGEREAGFVQATEIHIVADDPLPPGTGEQGGEAEIAGAIGQLVRTPDGSVVQIWVNEIRIHLNSETVIEGPAGFVSSRALVESMGVRIKGVWRTDGSVLAKKIEIED